MSKFLESSIKDIINKYSNMFLAKKNVIGVGLAYKIIKGIDTKEPVLHIMVEEKIPKENLYTKDLIPSNFLGIKTDVVEVGKTTYLVNAKKQKTQVFDKKIRPLQGGCSISPINRGYAATLTAIVLAINKCCT